MSNVRSITPNDPANFTPELGNYKTLQPFRYWCQKVLPLVYDDSLSYYELLCKVVDYLNKTMEDVETLHGDVTNLHSAYEELQSYVNNYFSTLDVQEEINNKLNSMVEDGTFEKIFSGKVILEKTTGINILNINYISETSFVENGHKCNGFTADVNYYYVLSSVSDDDNATLTIINKVTLSVENITLSIKGHLNSLCIYNNYFYTVDSLTSTIYKISTLDYTIASIQLPFFKMNALDIFYDDVNNNIMCVGNQLNNHNVSIYYLVGETFYLMCNITLENIPNSYVQGINGTHNAIYTSRSYANNPNFNTYQLIQVHGYNGLLLNEMYLPTNDEIEDIYRDTKNNKIYFCFNNGKIGFVDTLGFTTEQTQHWLSSYELRSANLWIPVLMKNDDTRIHYYNNTTLEEYIDKPLLTNKEDGVFFGVGLICGHNAIFTHRTNCIYGMCCPIVTSSNIIMASVQYLFDGDKIRLDNGKVVRVIDGAVTQTDIKTFSTENPTNRTVINALFHLPNSVDYSTISTFNI